MLFLLPVWERYRNRSTPVIAEIAKRVWHTTVGVVTHPFSTEGGSKQYAEKVYWVRKYADTPLINNDKLIEVYGDLHLHKLLKS